METTPSFDKKALCDYMKEQIPMLEFQQMDILSYGTEGVTLSAPLAPNKNVHQTAYAGAITSLLTISSWLLVKAIMDDHPFDAVIVMQSCSVKYLRPVRDTLHVESFLPDQYMVEKSLQELKQHNKTRLTIKASILSEGKKMAVSEGVFHIHR